jgi:hypothetical protein
MSLKALHRDHYDRRMPLINGRGTPFGNAAIEKAHLPGADAARKANVLRMYEGLSPSERSKLRAQRAQRALDVIDLFHDDMRLYFGELNAEQRTGLLDVMLITNKLRAKLRGIAHGQPSEL